MNARSALKLAHVRGVALLVVAEAQDSPWRVFTDGSEDERCRLRPRGESAGADDGAIDTLARTRAARRCIGCGRRRHLPRYAVPPRCASDAGRDDQASRSELARRLLHAASMLSPATPAESSLHKVLPGQCSRLRVGRVATKTGEAVYKEAPDDENPVDFKMSAEDTERNLRSGRQAGSLQAPAGIESEGRQHGHEDLPIRGWFREERSEVQFLPR